MAPRRCSYENCLARLTVYNSYRYGSGYICRKHYQQLNAGTSQELGNDHEAPHDDNDEHPPLVQENPPSPATNPVEGFLYLPALDNTVNSCCICQKSTEEHGVNQAIMHQVWSLLNIVIPLGSRMCADHIDLDTGLLNENIFANIREKAELRKVSQPVVMHLLSGVTNVKKPTATATARTKLHFDNDQLQDDDYKVLTGMDKAVLGDLEHLCTPDVKKFKSASPRTCIGLFLTWVRLGLSQDVLATLFGLSQSTVSRILDCVRKSLMTRFVPDHLGYDHISRKEFIDRHSTEFGKLLCHAGPYTAIAIADGTYIYIEKSSNYSFQKKTYSVQKKTNLVKPMVVCSLTGYILQAEGPYYANGGNNDAAIMNTMLMDVDGFSSFFEEGDCLILDRGFRDSIALAQSLGLSVKSPNFIPKGDKQLDTEDANSSRVTTIMRWVIEAVNARIKSFKLLKNTVPNTYVPIIGDLVQIVCALINAYYPPIAVDKPEHTEIARRILDEIDGTNRLQELVLSTGLNRKRTIWTKVDISDIEDFPILTLEDLHHLTLGVYQVKQAESYTAEHMKNGQYELWYNKDKPNLLRVKIESRHTSSSHQLWVEYQANQIGASSIDGWYCECKVGARVIGMCAHVTSVLWFLGFARHHTELHLPADSVDRNIMDASAMEYDD